MWKCHQHLRLLRFVLAKSCQGILTKNFDTMQAKTHFSFNITIKNRCQLPKTINRYSKINTFSKYLRFQWYIKVPHELSTNSLPKIMNFQFCANCGRKIEHFACFYYTCWWFLKVAFFKKRIDFTIPVDGFWELYFLKKR